MRKYENLDLLLKSHNSVVDKAVFSDLLISDLNQACCFIFGETVDEQRVLLAELKIQEDSLHQYFGIFQQRIEFIVEGQIINNEYPPLTYSVNGHTFRFYGRCSVIPQICGVDLYLDKSYSEKVGEEVKQKFTIPAYKLFSSLK